MERQIMKRLVEWKDSPARKPLLLSGAPEVGKTWLLQDLGRRYFESVAYVPLEGNLEMRQEFDQGFDVDRLLGAMEDQTGQTITPGKTLVILDDIHECPRALTSLRYFYEQKPELAVAGTVSFLELIRYEGARYPAGKVTRLDLYPLTFLEYVRAVGEPQLDEILEESDPKLLKPFYAQLEEQLLDYFVVGGMPRAVSTFVDDRDYDAVREVQGDILGRYETNMTKNVEPYQSELIESAWHSIPTHLCFTNKRFAYSRVRDRATKQVFQQAIRWLCTYGIALKVPRVSQVKLPLWEYADTDTFKLFALDVGMLGTMAGLKPRDILTRNGHFWDFHNALAEQYVSQQLISACGLQPYYWNPMNQPIRVDFLVELDNRIYGIEAKAFQKLRTNALSVFHSKHPDVLPVRFSSARWNVEDGIVSAPLYAVTNPLLWSAPK